MTHATRGAPSTHTVQHPHWPWGLHPSLGERTTEALAQDLEQRRAVVGNLDVDPVDTQATSVGADSGAAGWVS